MSFQTAKKFIDYIFNNKYNYNFPISYYNTSGLIIEFIGGEPFLEIDLIDQITDYFEKKFLENPEDTWSLFHTYSFSSNGSLYFNNKVQKYIKKNSGRVSVSITVDGCKSFHDSCRVFPDGSGSYDLAIASALDQLHKWENDNTKITISPDNIDYLFEGFKNMIELGFTAIQANCIFEDVWNIDLAKKYYLQLKKIADWIKLKNIQDDLFFVIFSPDKYNFLSESQKDKGWCGTSDNMFALNYKGEIYTCIRFMESSLNQEPGIIGNIEHGIGFTKKEKYFLNNLKKYTARNISEKKCLNCPIAGACAYCPGCCYEQTGNLKKRTTTICDEIKVQALATMYYYKLINDKKSYDKIQKFSYDFVKDELKKHGYTLLDNEYKGNTENLTCLNKDGYKVHVKFGYIIGNDE